MKISGHISIISVSIYEKLENEDAIENGLHFPENSYDKSSDIN
jgi:hypothetical protein